MADDILINIRTVGRPEVEKAAQSIVEMGRVSEQMTGKLSLANRAIMRQVQADRQLKGTKATLRKAVRDQVITQGQMNAAMKEAHRAAREMVATDKEAIRIKKEAARKTKEQEDALHAARLEFDANYRVQQEVSRQLKALNLLYEEGTMDLEEYRAATARVNRDARQFYKGVADGGNQFARFNMAQYKAAQNLKRQFSTNVQQAGYQVGDFIVQVQSGQSALVALGQQGSQMAGVFGPTGAVVGAILAGATALGLIIQNAMKARAELDSFEDALEAIGEQSEGLYDIRDALFASLVDPVRAANSELTEYLRNIGSVKQKAFERTVDSALAEIETSRRTTATGQTLPVDSMTDPAMADAISGSSNRAQARDQLFNRLMKETERLKVDLRAALLVSTEAAIDPFIELTNLLEEAKKEFPNAEIFAGNATALDRIGDESGVSQAAAQRAIAGLTAQAEAERRLMDENAAYEKKAEEERQEGIKRRGRVLGYFYEFQNQHRQAAREQEEADREAAFKSYQAEIDLRFKGETELMNAKDQFSAKEDKARTRSDNFFKETLRNLKMQTAELYIQTEYHNDEEGFQVRMREMERRELRHQILKNNLNAGQAEQLMAQLDNLHDQEDALEAVLKKERERKEIADFLANNNPLEKQYNNRFAREMVVMGQSVGPNTSTKTDRTTGSTKKSDYQKALEAYRKFTEELQNEVEIQTTLGLIGSQEREIQEELLNLKKEYAILGKVFDEEEIERLLRKQQALETIADIGETIESSMESAFMAIVDGTKDAEQAFKNMASEIIKELYRIYVVKKTTGMIMAAIDLFTGAPPGSSASIAGTNANGGYVQAGSKYIVGERGPEVFTAPSNGYITPNKDLGSGGTTVVQNLNISTGVSQTVRAEIRQMMPQISAAAKSAVVDSKRRGGNYGKGF